MKQKEEKGRKESLTKKVVRNSSYDFSAELITKIFSLVFIIIIARLLQPELFGLYNIVLSVTLIFMTFTDLGINTALVRYVAANIRKKKKAAAYLHYLLKMKTILVFSIALIIVLIAKPLALYVFKGPDLFFPFMIAAAYLFFSSFTEFFASLFNAFSEFKFKITKEIIWQVTRLLFTLLLLFLIAKTVVNVSDVLITSDKALVLSGAVLALVLCSFVTLIFIFFITRKRYSSIFIKTKIERKERKILLRYVLFLSIAMISAVFFAYIDTIMLGAILGAKHAEYVGFYRAAYALVMTASGLIAFGAVLFPVFSQLSFVRVKQAFNRSLRISLIFSFPIAFGLAFIAKPFIKIIYGQVYLPACFPLYILSFLILTTSFSLYTIFFNAREKPETPTKFMVIATVMNIILNYILIKSMLKISQLHATLGAAIATLASNIFLYSALMIATKKQFKISPNIAVFTKPFFASIIMVAFLLAFNRFVGLVWPLAIIEIVLAAAVYFIVMFLIRGIKKEDFELFKLLRS